MNSKQVGDFGEKIATDYLRDKKYKILENNFKRKWGEIDIVGKKDKKIIFFEVKTMHKIPGFFPEDQISLKKKNQLRKITQIYLSENKIPLNTRCQIDVLTIEIDSVSEKTLEEIYKK